MKRWLIYVLFAVSCMITFLFSFASPDKVFFKLAISNLSYYFILFTFFFWIAFIVRDLTVSKEGFINYVEENAWGIILSVIISAIFFFSVTAKFRILADETNLISMSRSMFLNRTAVNSVCGNWYYNSYHSLALALDVRPGLFPFLVSIIHTVIGYSPYNGFVLNGILVLLVFFNLFLLIKTFFGEKIALVNILMCASFPIVALCARSSGFEMLNLFFVIVTVRYFYDYLINPRALKFNKVMFTLVLLAQCRYETIGISLFFLLIIIHKEIRAGLKNITLAVAAIPVLSLSAIWQINFSLSIFSKVMDSNLPLFGIGYFIDNISSFMRFFFLPMQQQPVNVAGSYLAVIGLFYVCVIFFNNRRIISGERKTIAAVCAFIFIYYLISFGFSRMGLVDQPVNFRYLLIFIPFFAFLASFFMDAIFRKLNLQDWIAPTFMALFVFFHPLAVNDPSGNGLILQRRYVLDQKFLESFAKKKTNVLIITDRPGMYTIFDFGACNFAYANAKKDQILNEFKNNLFTDIIVIQEIRYDTGKPVDNDVLDESYKLKAVHEVLNVPGSFIRYSIVEQ